MSVPEELIQRIVQETNLYLDELQRHNLLQAHQVAIGVDAITCGGASAGLEQAKPVIVVERPDGDSGALGKFVRLISTAHPRPSLLNKV